MVIFLKKLITQIHFQLPKGSAAEQINLGTHERQGSALKQMEKMKPNDMYLIKKKLLVSKIGELSKNLPQRTKPKKKFITEQGSSPVELLLRKQMNKLRRHSVNNQLWGRMSLMDYILGMHRRSAFAIMKKKDPYIANNKVTLNR